MYLFLSTVYLQPPTPELVRKITEEKLLDELSLLLDSEPVMDLKEYAFAEHSENDLSILKQEYMDLFAVPTGRYVTPFEDVYRGTTTDGAQERGLLLGERAVAARQMYREAGADMEKTCKELPNHIGVELSFMCFLCERESAELHRGEGKELLGQANEQETISESYRALQVRFLHDHLNAWFPALSQTIQANAKTNFYRGLARVTEAFLSKDAANLTTEAGPRSV
jgi:TorA maturation chaperone TorD